MIEEELQSLDSTYQESTIHDLVAIGVEQEHTIDQESTIHELVAVGVEQEYVVGVNTSDQMVFDVGQTHASTNGAAHVIKNVVLKLLSKLDLQETEEQQIARYLSGLKPSIQDSLSMYPLCTLSEAYSRAIMMERQLARKAMQLQNLGGSRNHVLPASKPWKGNGVNKERSQNSSANGVVFKCYVW
nr:hypothetical protein CFP56_59797 [Quercus suber]